MRVMVLQAPGLAPERSGKAAKAGYESGEQAAVSTPPIMDVGLTPRKRKHAESARATGEGAGAAVSPPSRLRRLEAVSGQPPPQPVEMDTTEAAHHLSGMGAVPAAPYAHAARGAYVATLPPSQRAPAPSLLDPASKPLDVTLQVRRQILAHAG